MDAIGSLKIVTHQIGEQMVVVALHGDMDIYTTSRAKDMMEQFLEKGCCRLIVDLHQVAYLDSTALGMLIALLRHAREHGGGLRLVAPRNHVRRLLEVTRLTMTFPIDATAEEAESHFAEESQVA